MADCHSTDLSIDPIFRALIPPLQAEERAQLETCYARLVGPVNGD